MYEYQQGVTTYGLPFRLIDANDETQVVTGASPSVAICKSGQTAFSAGSGTVTELADGAYKYNWSASDLNTLGPMLVKITATGAVTLTGRVDVVSHNPGSLLGPSVAGRTVALDASGGVALDSTINGSAFTAIPWNAAWDDEVQSEAADAFAGTEILLSADAITAMAQGVRTELTVELDRIDAPISESTLSQEAIDDIIDGINEGIAPPRINMRPDPGFTFQVSRRADGTYKCTRPLRIAPGAVETIHPAIDMSPLFGQFNYVQTVGTPSISGGSLTVAAEGARDTYAILEVDGTATASEERTITVVVTMTSGASVQVKLDVEVFDE